jgi:RecB family endonuclease NucS
MHVESIYWTFSLFKEDENLFSYQNVVIFINYEKKNIMILSWNITKPLFRTSNINIYNINDKIIEFKNKKNNFKLNIHKIENKSLYDKISHNININETENNIKKDISVNFNKFFPEYEFLSNEYVTDYWNIDILWKHKLSDKFLIIEIKKTDTDYKAIDQCVRYWKYFHELNYECELYVVWLKSTKKNNIYAKDLNVHILHYLKK